jgi:hypothetical protein
VISFTLPKQKAIELQLNSYSEYHRPLICPAGLIGEVSGPPSRKLIARSSMVAGFLQQRIHDGFMNPAGSRKLAQRPDQNRERRYSRATQMNRVIISLGCDALNRS